MKKNLKKLLSLAFVLALVFSLSISAFAADISADKAKEIALVKAGYAASDVVNLKAVVDYDDGLKLYEVSFLVPQTDGSYFEYEYDIGAADGSIYDYDIDRECKVNGTSKPVAGTSAVNGGDIGLEAAKKAAVAHFGLSESEVKFLVERQDYDDGVLVYEFEFVKGYEIKYSGEVVADSGLVRDAEKEIIISLSDKIELFFELIFIIFFNI